MIRKNWTTAETTGALRVERAESAIRRWFSQHLERQTALEESNLKTRQLGKLEVSEMGFGCMSISANYGPAASINQGINVIRAALNKGVTRSEERRVGKECR